MIEARLDMKDGRIAFALSSPNGKVCWLQTSRDCNCWNLEQVQWSDMGESGSLPGAKYVVVE